MSQQSSCPSPRQQINAPPQPKLLTDRSLSDCGQGLLRPPSLSVAGEFIEERRKSVNGPLMDTKALEGLPTDTAQLQYALLKERMRNSALQKAFDDLKQTNARLALRLDEEVEFMSNKMMRQLHQYRRDKETLLNQAERDEEALTNALGRTLHSALEEKLYADPCSTVDGCSVSPRSGSYAGHTAGQGSSVSPSPRSPTPEPPLLRIASGGNFAGKSGRKPHAAEVADRKSEYLVNNMASMIYDLTKSLRGAELRCINSSLDCLTSVERFCHSLVPDGLGGCKPTDASAASTTQGEPASHPLSPTLSIASTLNESSAVGSGVRCSTDGELSTLCLHAANLSLPPVLESTTCELYLDEGCASQVGAEGSACCAPIPVPPSCVRTYAKAVIEFVQGKKTEIQRQKEDYLLQTVNDAPARRRGTSPTPLSAETSPLLSSRPCRDGCVPGGLHGGHLSARMKKCGALNEMSNEIFPVNEGLDVFAEAEEDS